MFQACTILPYLDVSDWDTSNVTDMYCLFCGSENLNGLDVSDWDVSNVTNMAYTFWHCYSLENLDVADWDVGNVTTFEDMFAGKHNLGNMKVVPAVENWDMSSATSIRDMFYGCAQIETLDLSKWVVTDVKDMRHTFADCFGLKSINFSGWNTPNLENLDGTFNDCLVLTDLDMSNFNTSKVSTMAQLFEGCASLTTVKGMEKWDTTSLRDVAEMFYTNGRGSSLEVVDLSSFNTAALRNTSSMFGGCYKLTTVYVGDGWDLSNVTAHGGMFAGCTGLVGANGSTVADLKAVDKTYACVDAEGTPGYLTYKPAQNP
jgi:surface protein